LEQLYSLDDLGVGCTARIEALTATGALRRRLLDMGLVEGTRIECLGRSPMGDPSAFLVRGAALVIRRADCRNIWIYEHASGRS